MRKTFASRIGTLVSSRSRHTPKFDSGSFGGTQRSSTQKSCSLSHGTVARNGCDGSESSLNVALGVEPPEMAMRAIPRDATACSTLFANRRAEARAIAAAEGHTWYVTVTGRGISFFYSRVVD